MRREYLDALIESYVLHFSKGGDVVRVNGEWTFRGTTDEYRAARDEVQRLCSVQRHLGLKDYFERLTA